MSDRTAIPLTYPVQSNGVPISSLSLRRPKVRDMLLAEKQASSQAEREVRMIANLCEVAPTVIEDLDFADYSAAQTVLKGFLS
ncbi:MAG: phage tail assembly protein [Variovorax sp.]|nr:phage tail assembly protein [Xanthomonadaceae bacterium]MDZ4358707.1 phage tail assembly protein [Variovorax sp.]